MSEPSPEPTYEAVLTDIGGVLRAGAGGIRTLELPALRRIAVLLDIADEADREPAPVVQLLRDVVARFEIEGAQEAASYALGLIPGTARWKLQDRRAAAGEVTGVSWDSYRKSPEDDMVKDVAEETLGLLRDHAMRTANAEMAGRRHPADSRLAVQWVERFEAYNRIWTPAWALAADLEAALATYLDEPADHFPWDPTSAEKYDPVDQARGYARNALYRYAQFLLEVKRFKLQHGGLWLFSDPQVEEDVSNAVYRIGWHNSFNEEDDAWLRRNLADSRHEESDSFRRILESSSVGSRIHDEWQVLVEEGIDRGQNGLNDLPVRLTVKACRDYVRLVDEDWLRISDWYRPGVYPRKRQIDQELYREHVSEPTSRSDEGI